MGVEDRRNERRPDMPVVRKRELGAMSLATEAARSVRSRQDALRDLERDMYARTSAGPREALLATWERFHKLWYGEEVPVLPLTEEKLLRVTSLFKLVGIDHTRITCLGLRMLT